MATEQRPEQRKPRHLSRPEELARALLDLEMLTVTLKFRSKYLLMMAFLSLASVIGSVIGRSVWPADAVGPALPALITIVVMMPLIGLMILFSWEVTVREGKILYEEISDEVEWRHRTSRKKKAAHGVGSASHDSEVEDDIGRPNIEVRVALRKFVRASTLPFVSDSVSSTVYAIYFVSCTVFIAMVIAARIGSM